MKIPALLIEDNITIRDTLIPALEELADVEVIAVVDTAVEAIAAMHDHADRWQLAIVDMFLREGSGIEVLEAAMNRDGSQRVVVLSNYATRDMRARCGALGANAVFDKSTELDAFFACCINDLRAARA